MEKQSGGNVELCANFVTLNRNRGCLKFCTPRGLDIQRVTFSLAENSFRAERKSCITRVAIFHLRFYSLIRGTIVSESKFI